MKQIIDNAYIKVFKLASSKEAATFALKQETKNILSIDDICGDSYYCYVGYHSLTREKQFVLSFSSDENEDKLNILYWDDLLVFDTAKNIYLIEKSLNIKASLEITTPLVGLYLVNRERLLILEEAYMRVINCEGEIVKSELFDLLEDFSIKDNLLSIQTSEGNKVIKLT
jgi:hypothetical protein